LSNSLLNPFSMFPRAISVEFRRPVLTLDIALPTSLPELHYFWEAALQEHNVDSIGVRSENVASAVCELKKSPSNRLEDTGLLEIRRCPADPVVESWRPFWSNCARSSADN
jgi:hypothetical protein